MRAPRSLRLGQLNTPTVGTVGAIVALQAKTQRREAKRRNRYAGTAPSRESEWK